GAGVIRLRRAIGGAAMVKKPRRVPRHVAIQVLLIIEREDIRIVLLTSAQRLALGDLLTQVFEDARAFANSRLRKSAGPVDRRGIEQEQFRLGGRRLLRQVRDSLD